jgi:hypothetical protein
MDFNKNDSGLEQVPRGGGKERRIHPRLDRWGTAWIGVLPEGPKVAGYLCNLSQGGCSIEADAEIPAQRGTSIEVLLRVSGLRLRIAGVIRHLEKSKTRAGIEFSAMSNRKAEQIVKLVKTLAEAGEKGSGNEEIQK